jgi:hypothetical protein
MTGKLFRYEPAEDDSIDDQYVLVSNTNITIQDARSYGGDWSVNEWVDGTDPYSLSHGSFKTLKAAQAAALAIRPRSPAKT